MNGRNAGRMNLRGRIGLTEWTIALDVSARCLWCSRPHPTDETLLLGGLDREGLDPLDEYCRVDQFFSQQGGSELEVLLAPSGKLGCNAVVGFETQPSTGLRTFVLEDHKAGLPAGTENCRRGTHAFGVVLVHLVEWRKLTDRPFNLV